MPERAPEPRGIYVHVPWCRRRCPYCDFYFVVGRAEPAFATAVLDELAARWPAFDGGAGAPARTLYFGGGTPSALAVEHLGAIVDGVRRYGVLAKDAEITVEANPEDVDAAFIDRLGAVGVNRLSLGVQSFDDDALKWLGRMHTGADAARAVTLGRTLGRVSVDVIAGLPHEDLGRTVRDLERAVALGAGHVSAYLLTVEAGTPLEGLITRGKRDDVDHDAQADAYEAIQATTARLGLIQYEVSSYARAGEESRHNRIYWGQGEYLGLGPGAHSMQLEPTGEVLRTANAPDLRSFLNDPKAVARESERLSPGEAYVEAVGFGLRDLRHGVNVQDLAARHRVKVPAGLREVLAERATRGHLCEREGRWFLTAEGARFADGVARDILALVLA